MTNLNEMKSNELKALAKEQGIKNWWTLKKADLIAELEKVNPSTELPELTDKEKAVFLSLKKDDFWEQDNDSLLWLEIATDTAAVVTGLSDHAVGGVITSLNTKGLIDIDPNADDSNPQCKGMIWLTDLGKQVMDSLGDEEPQTFKKKAAEKPEEKVNEEDLVTLKDMLIEYKIKGTKARRILRGKDIERPYKRWEWHKDLHANIIAEVRSILQASIK